MASWSTITPSIATFTVIFHTFAFLAIAFQLLSSFPRFCEFKDPLRFYMKFCDFLIFTPNAFTTVRTNYSYFKAITVFFLTVWFFTVTSFFLTFFNGIKALFLWFVWNLILFVFLLIGRGEVLWWRVLAPRRWLDVLLVRMDWRLMMVGWRATKLRIDINRFFIRRADKFHLNAAFDRSLVLER